MELSQDDLAEIQRLLEDSPYGELTVETGRLRITLRRAKGGGWTQETQALPQPVLVSPLNQATEKAAAKPTERSSAATEDGLLDIFPPLPGTFYRAPKPGADPFVEVGSHVTEDMVIGIIETMKLINPARAQVTGTIVEICAANGELVETGHVLMRVRPHAGGQA